MTPDQASAALRAGKQLDVDVNVAEQALALAIPHLFRHINPTQTDGRSGFAKFRKLCDNAGLPDDHIAFATWLTLRALRVEAGDALIADLDCPVTDALISTLGLVRAGADAHIIRTDRTNHSAISITADAPITGEVGIITTPAGVIRIPGTSVTSLAGSWAAALSAIDQVTATLGRKPYDADPDAPVELNYTRPQRAGSVDIDSIHEDWSPEIAYHPDLKRHPSQLIQSATLATVTPPQITYKPRLPRRVITSGLISDAQFEFIAAAGEAHSRHLPVNPQTPHLNPERVGMYLADGTGAGKTNAILGTILDNFLRGRRKAVIVLGKRRHRRAFIDAWAQMGKSRRDFILHWEAKRSQQITAPSGILLTTYSTLRDYIAASEEYPAIQQIIDWVGKDFDGVLAFDEAQEMRNAAANEDLKGRAEISRQGLAGIEIQDCLRDARVIYASATGATDVYNLAYATRLGLWGPGTCFKSRLDFIRTFEDGDIGDLEQVTLSLKAAGVYVARMMSFAGVDTRHLPVTLTKEERHTYNCAADAWIKLWQNYLYCANLCGARLHDKEALQAQRHIYNTRGRTPYSDLSGVFEASRKASMSTLIASFKARAVIADAKAQLEKGNAVVIQMQNTYEAQLNRALERAEDPNNIRLEPAELVAFAERLPTQIVELVEDHDNVGNKITRFRPKVDTKGNPVEHPQAVAIRNALIAEMRAIKLPLPPLDQIMLEFGPARISEVTGRTKRLIPDRPNGQRDGSTGMLVEERNENDRVKDIDAFHNGDKKILVFSTGAGGASLSYHAKIGTKNTARRVHYVIQLGYRADEVTQGFGRTHRSDQVHPPILTIVSCDMPADRLYASRIVSALFKMGALTQGHRHAASHGMFDERDCLDSKYAMYAWIDLMKDIADGAIKGYTWEQFAVDMGLDTSEARPESINDTYVFTNQLTNINKMINRIAALPDRRQDTIFGLLRDRIDKRIEQAIADGTFNAGPEVLKANSLTLVGEKVIAHDPIHGAATRLLRVRKISTPTLTHFGEAFKKYVAGRRNPNKIAYFAKHRTTGNIALICTGRPYQDPFYGKTPTYDIITPTSTANRPCYAVEREPWIPVADMNHLEGLWNNRVEACPLNTISYITLVTDGLLPVWNALAHRVDVRHAVYRLQTDDGRQIVGRPISADAVTDFCRWVKAVPEPTNGEVNEIVEQLTQGYTVALTSGRRSSPHILHPVFTGTALTGIKITLGEEVPAKILNEMGVDTGASDKETLRSKTVLTLAYSAGHIASALTAILTRFPALYIDNSVSTKPIAATGTVTVPLNALNTNSNQLAA